MDETIRKFALQNAVEHGGKADKGSVMSRVLGERADLRPRAKEVAVAADRILSEVNAMPADAQRAALQQVAPALLGEKKRERHEGLPPLQDAVKGKVVMRFAPGPSGPLHLGHARAAYLNDEYCRTYEGSYILRLEDTDPARVLPDAYNMIVEDMGWMGCKVDKVVIQSDRFERYYEVARKLIEMGKAYVCTDPPETWRHLKERKQACAHRHLPPDRQLEGFEAMLGGAFKPEKAAVIAATDLDHPNPAVRDFPILRIEDTPHPRTGTRFRVYPLMNFSVAVDDHDLGLTHVLRGKDHLSNTHRQEYLFRYLGWKMPHYIHYGRARDEDMEFSTSKTAAGIARGEYSGWDDPRLGTIRSLARRGYRPESLRDYWISAGVKEVDVIFSWDNLNAIDKKRADPEAVRLFFVANPVEIDATLPGDLVAHPPRLPDRPQAGTRDLFVRGDKSGHARLLVAADDAAKLSQGSVFRLKDLANFRWQGPGVAHFLSKEVGAAKGAAILHWLPADPDQIAPARLHMPDGLVTAGKIERAAATLHGKVVQLERVGLARLEVVGAALGEVDAFFLYR